MRARRRPVLVEIAIVAERETDFRVILHELDMPRNALRDDDVVGIKEAKKLACAARDSTIARDGTPAAILLVVVTDARFIAVGNFGGPVGGTVVDDDDLQVP